MGEQKHFLVPPVYLVGKVLRHMQHYGTKGVLVVPYWVSAPFWVQLLESKNVFKGFVEEVLIFEDFKACITQGKNKNCFIGSDNFKSSILAIKLEFS